MDCKHGSGVPNILLDAVVMEVLSEVFGSQEAQHGLGWSVGERKLIFYTNYDQIGGRDQILCKII